MKVAVFSLALALGLVQTVDAGLRGRRCKHCGHVGATSTREVLPAPKDAPKKASAPAVPNVAPALPAAGSDQTASERGRGLLSRLRRR